MADVFIFVDARIRGESMNEAILRNSEIDELINRFTKSNRKRKLLHSIVVERTPIMDVVLEEKPDIGQHELSAEIEKMLKMKTSFLLSVRKNPMT